MRKGTIQQIRQSGKTGQQRREKILRDRRLRWLGHVTQVDHQRSNTLGGRGIQGQTRSAEDKLRQSQHMTYNDWDSPGKKQRRRPSRD